MATRCYRTTFGQVRCRNNAWGGWGRWVLLGVLLAVFLLAALLFACISARRRRKLGRRPFMGTGWAAGGVQGPVTYNNNSNKPSQMEQGYNTNTNTYGNNTQPYYAGGQANDYYNSNGTGQAPNYDSQPGGYQPPSYPPPAQTRGDGIVR